MRLFRCKRALVLLGLLVLILMVVIPLIVFLVLAEQKEHIPGGVRATPRISQAPGGAKSWPVISRNVPVFASPATVPDPKEETGASVIYTQNQDGGISHGQETENPRSLVYVQGRVGVLYHQQCGRNRANMPCYTRFGYASSI